MKKICLIVALVLALSIFAVAFASCSDSAVDIDQKLRSTDTVLESQNVGDNWTINVTTDIYAVYVRQNDLLDKVVVYYVNNPKHTVTLEEKTTTWTLNVNEKSSSLVLAHQSNCYMVIEVPSSWANLKLNVTTSVGSVQVEDFDLFYITVITETGRIVLDDIDVKNTVIAQASTGSIYLDDVNCLDLKVKCGTGLVDANVDVSREAVITNETGSIKFDGDASNVTLKNETGAIRFDAKASFVYAQTETGSISGKVEGVKENYVIDATTETGRCNVKNQGTYDGVTPTVTLKTQTGSISLKFYLDK